MKRKNFILALHPFTNLLGIISIILTALIIGRTKYFYLGFFIFLVISILANKSKEFLKSFMIFVFPIGLILGIIISLFMSGEVLYDFIILNITREGLVRANILVSRLFLISGGIILFFNIIVMKDLILSLEDKGVSRDQTFTILSMVQVFDEFNRNISKFIAVSKTRGVRIERNVFERIRVLFPMVLPIYQISRQSIENNLLLMETRGFSLELSNSDKTQVPYSKFDKTLKSLFYLIPIVVYIWRVLR